MKIIALSDLHFRMNPDWDSRVEALAGDVAAEGGDVLVIAGDVACADAEGFEECLSLFAPFPGRKLLVPGNHDLWTKGERSLRLYEEVLPDLCRRRGFEMLDAGPARVGADTAFVGSIGWYDYSYRAEHLDVPAAWYRDKCYPGLLLWMDVRFVRLPWDDPGFTGVLLERLRAQLEAVRGVSRVVAVFHHIPFAGLVTRREDAAWTFGNAFMGAACFGRLLEEYPNVRLCLSAHSHRPGRIRVGHIDAVNLGSTYASKKMEIFHLD
jgi:predicted phosphohydrolase